MEFKGKRGIVEVREEIIGRKNVLVAVKRPLTKFYDGKTEFGFLRKLNEKKIGPKAYYFDEKNNSLVMQYIEGDRVLDHFALKKTTKKEILSVIQKILLQLFCMDKLGINKLEMTNPYKHVIITNAKTPVMIDFERCHYTEYPKNITQFIQFLCSGRLNYVFAWKKLSVNKEKLLEIARLYKQTYDKKYISSIMKQLS